MASSVYVRDARVQLRSTVFSVAEDGARGGLLEVAGREGVVAVSRDLFRGGVGAKLEETIVMFTTIRTHFIAKLLFN